MANSGKAEDGLMSFGMREKTVVIQDFIGARSAKNSEAGETPVMSRWSRARVQATLLDRGTGGAGWMGNGSMNWKRVWFRSPRVSAWVRVIHEDPLDELPGFRNNAESRHH
jgi:hypothetical protein